MKLSVALQKHYLVYLYVLLGALSAFPPLVTDMYLPSLPAMAAGFGATPSEVQMGLAACIVGLALGQLLFGPMSDRYGRRPLLKCALVLYMLSTIGCIFAPTIWVFNLFRLFQGFGGAGGVVLSRSVATDCYSGRQLAKTLAVIGAINGIAPVAAPVVGGIFSEALGWQGIFWILLGVGATLYVMTLPFHESLPDERRCRSGVGTMLRQPLALLANARYVRPVAVFALTNGVLFAYISSASFIIQQNFGLSEMGFGLLFAFNSLGIVSGSMLALKFRRLETASLTGAAGMFVAAGLQIASAVSGMGIMAYEICAFVMLFCVGLVFPSSTAIAMTEGKSAIGWASAIVGATGFLCGGIVTPLAGLGDIRVTSAVVIAVCAAIALVTCLARRGK